MRLIKKKQVIVRLTDSQKTELIARAQENNLNLSQYILNELDNLKTTKRLSDYEY